MKEPIIWALFDDGFGSWNKLGKNNIISIGYNENKDWKNYIKIDLSITNPNLIKELEKLERPDIIIASPPCESWSNADNSRRAFKSIKDGIVRLLTQEENNNLNQTQKNKRNFFKQQSKRLLGESTILATIEIIEHFKPKTWIIENPKTSKIFEYINSLTSLKGIKNNTYYNNYDQVNFTKKPTTFLSNINLNLLNNNIISENKWNNFNNGKGYNLSSSIPKKLIENIYKELQGVK